MVPGQVRGSRSGQGRLTLCSCAAAFEETAAATGIPNIVMVVVTGTGGGGNDNGG